MSLGPQTTWYPSVVSLDAKRRVPSVGMSLPDTTMMLMLEHQRSIGVLKLAVAVFRPAATSYFQGKTKGTSTCVRCTQLELFVSMMFEMKKCYD